MKSTPTRGVKQFLKPDTYKQLEGKWRFRLHVLPDSVPFV